MTLKIQNLIDTLSLTEKILGIMVQCLLKIPIVKCTEAKVFKLYSSRSHDCAQGYDANLSNFYQVSPCKLRLFLWYICFAKR